MDKLSTHYQYLFEWRHLRNLEKLIVRDTRLNIDWYSVLNLNSDNFPKLVYLEIPQNAMSDYKPESVASHPNFQNLHLKYHHGFTSQGAYMYKSANRFSNYLGVSPLEASRMLSVFNWDKIELRHPIIGNSSYYSSNYLSGINYSNVDEYNLWGALQNVKSIDLLSKFSDGLTLFTDMQYTNITFDTLLELGNLEKWLTIVLITYNIDTSLRISDFGVLEKDVNARRHEDFRFYEFVPDYEHPLEEFRVRNKSKPPI